MIVYADILFLINFSMDFLTLYFTGKVLSKPMKTVRLCLSASSGALFGTMITVLCDRTTLTGTVILTATGIGVSLIMALVAYGKYKSFLPLLRDGIVLWGGGALLGGVMTAVLSLGEPVFVGAGESPEFAVAFIVCFAASSVITRLFSAGRGKKSVTVVIEAGGEKATFTALADSGNIAREPISCRPVVIIASCAVPKLAGMTERHDERLAIRIVPVHSLGGERVLTGFLPDRIEIDGREVAAVAVIDKENKSFGGQSGIVPAVLCGGEKTIRRKKRNEKRFNDQSNA